MSHPTSPGRLPDSSWLVDRLVTEGRITHHGRDVAIQQAKKANSTLEDAIIDVGLMSEADLLKILAAFYQTRFVSTEKLGRASIDDATLELLPRKLVDRFVVCPILMDRRTSALSVVTPYPNDFDLQKQIQVATGVREVKVYVARPAAVLAAIRKHYDGESFAFDHVSKPAAEDLKSVEMALATYTGHVLDEKGITSAALSDLVDLAPGHGARMGQVEVPKPAAVPRGVTQQGMPTQARGGTSPGSPVPRPPGAAPAAPREREGTVPGLPVVPDGVLTGVRRGTSPGLKTSPDLKITLSDPPPPMSPAAQAAAAATRGLVAAGPGMAPSSAGSPAGAIPAGRGNTLVSHGGAAYIPDYDFPEDTPTQVGFAPAMPAAARVGTSPGAYGMPAAAPAATPVARVEAPDEPAADATEIANVLVTLLENGRSELRGHSAHVARLVKQLADRIGLGANETRDVVLAANLHDIGKSSSYHLTALNVAEYEGHRAQAQKSSTMPVRLFETAKLPRGTVLALTHLYERWDGRGFPDRLSGKDVPLAARMLALAETYSDVTTNPRNPFRRTLQASEACEVLARYRGKVFDPNLVELFKLVVLGDDLKTKLMTDRSTVLLVDPDAEETTVLELRFVEAGFEVLIARNTADAKQLLESKSVDLIVAETELQPVDGFSFVQAVRANAKTADVPVVFLTKRSSSDAAQRGFQVGASDYVVKPANAEVVVAKSQQLVQTRAQSASKPRGRGVSGSLEEMSLPDVVQILAHGRKSGKLTIASGGNTGEVHFVDGQIFNATFGKSRGEDAFYAMLLLTQGDFALDPDHRASERVIHGSTESLLLEGLRRLDEGRAR